MLDNEITFNLIKKANSLQNILISFEDFPAIGSRDDGCRTSTPSMWRRVTSPGTFPALMVIGIPHLYKSFFFILIN